MAGAKLTYRLSGLTEASRKLSSLADDKHRLELADRLAAVLESGTVDRFVTSKAPDGTPWAPVARGGMPLVDKGRLMTSVASNATPNYVEIGSNLVYAAIHQYGGTIRAKAAKYLSFPFRGGWARVKQVTIKARPYLGISDGDRKTIHDTMGAYFAEVLK